MPLISAGNLTRRFPGVTALDALDLELEPGIIGLAGANGAGKTTLIKILLGLLEPTAGTSSVLGFDPLRNPVELRRFVGYMPEHDCLPSDITATEFVSHMARLSGLPSTAARERTAETLRHVGLYEERYRPIGGYSTGMKQRVKLAQALVHDPRLLLLDEPTNGLDPTGRDEMLEIIRRIGTAFGIAVLMSSHLLAEIERVCDYVVVLDAGRLHSAGPIGRFSYREEVLAVEVAAGVEELARSLARHGLKVTSDERLLFVVLTDGSAYDLIRDTVAEMGLALVRLEQRRQGLEQLFRNGAASVTNAVA